MNIERYNAEDFINLIEQERFDKISNYGMELIAIRFRELQNQGQNLPLDSVSHRRELLIDFLDDVLMCQDEGATIVDREKYVDGYLGN